MSPAGGDAPDVAAHVEWMLAEVAERVGVPARTLRSWDRRYGVGPSHRSAGPSRGYDEHDVLRLRTMRRLTEQGLPALVSARVVLSSDPSRLAALAAGD